MLDLARLQRIRLHPRPAGQRRVADLLGLNYRLAGVEVVVDGLEHMPKGRPFFVAMNHTDRFNYFGLQWYLIRTRDQYFASWAKGKYYEKAFSSWFLENTNNIPLPSRGYVIATEFRRCIGRAPQGQEYRLLRDLADLHIQVDDPAVSAGGADLARFIGAVGGDPGEHVESLFTAMAREVARLTQEALDLGCPVQVFPEGTRQVPMGRGHTGLAQMVQHLGAAVIPVGCSGSDRCYPGDSPWARKGRIHYRIGRTIPVDDPLVANFRVGEPFVPFTRAASRAHGQTFQAWTDVVMDQIATLLEPPYRPGAAAGAIQAEAGLRRFI